MLIAPSDFQDYYENNLVDKTEEIVSKGAKTTLNISKSFIMEIYYNYCESIWDILEDEAKDQDVIKFVQSRININPYHKDYESLLVYLAIEIVASWYSEKGLNEFIETIKPYSVFA